LCFGVDGRFGKLREGFIRHFFLIKGLLEELGRLRHIQPLSPGNKSAVARNFVVFYGLGRGEQCGIKCWRALELFDAFLTFLDKSLNRFALLALRSLFKEAEDFLKPIDLPLRLALMLPEGRLKSGDWAAFAILGSAVRIFFSA